jgi:hypothetical protein
MGWTGYLNDIKWEFWVFYRYKSLHFDPTNLKSPITQSPSYKLKAKWISLKLIELMREFVLQLFGSLIRKQK